MKIKLTICWVFFWCNFLVFGGVFEWEKVKKELVGHFPEPSNPEDFPNSFRETVYNLIRERNDGYSDEIIEIIRAIPLFWMESDGQLFMEALVDSNPPGLKYLSKEVLAALLNNLDHACQSITLDALLSLEQEDLKLVSPSCTSAISGLERMDLSKIIVNFRKDVFSEYNGALSKETIQGVSAEQLHYYGTLVRNDRICTLLELQHLGLAAITGVTSKCLYGYFSNQIGIVGLGELWKGILPYRIESFAWHMRPSLVNIPQKDFDWMTPRLLQVILYNFKVCPTIEISFWNEERIEHICSECLYRIFATADVPVKLGEKLWKKINSKVIKDFTAEMQFSWLNIHRDDFYFMKTKILKVITSAPKVCLMLGSTFWTKERIHNMGGECLYELLTQNNNHYQVPVKLGELWRDIPTSSFYQFTKRVKFSWSFIHPDEYDLVEDKARSSIIIYPEICSTFDSSFWTRRTIRHVTISCLYNILTGTKGGVPIALGELWGNLPPITIKDPKLWMLKGLKNAIGNDFQYMSPEFLKLLFSLDKVVDYLPQPPTRVILSSKASKVEMTPAQFAILARSAPSVAGQLLWYSDSLSDNVLSDCNQSDILKLRLIIPGEGQLKFNALFTRLKEKYSLTGRDESFKRMMQPFLKNASILFCAASTDLDE